MLELWLQLNESVQVDRHHLIFASSRHAVELIYGGHTGVMAGAAVIHCNQARVHRAEAQGA